MFATEIQRKMIDIYNTTALIQALMCVFKPFTVKCEQYKALLMAYGSLPSTSDWLMNFSPTYEWEV